MAVMMMINHTVGGLIFFFFFLSWCLLDLVFNYITHIFW
jgi:hypothetical protein